MIHVINNIKKEVLKAALVSYVCIFSLFGTVFHENGKYQLELVVFVFIYILTGYIRKYWTNTGKIPGKLKSCLGFLASWMCISALMALGSYNAGSIIADEIYQYGNFFYGYFQTIPNLICSFSLFFLFYNFRMKGNAIVNWLAASSFGIIIFHNVPGWNSYFYIRLLHSTWHARYLEGWKLVIYGFSGIFLIYAVGMVLEITRQFVSRLVIEDRKWYRIICKTINGYYNGEEDIDTKKAFFIGLPFFCYYITVHFVFWFKENGFIEYCEYCMLFGTLSLVVSIAVLLRNIGYRISDFRKDDKSAVCEKENMQYSLRHERVQLKRQIVQTKDLKEKIFNYLKLLRPKHYVKNGLIIFPLFFHQSVLEIQLVEKVIIGIIVFSLVSSIVYIINDINDIESDRKSEKKKYRPIASGAVSKKEAVWIAVVLLTIVIILSGMLEWKGMLWIFLYFVMNVAYSFKLKQIPIIDVVILASGFLIRMLYGGEITDISISFWLCMTVIALSFYMGLGKRRNELEKAGDMASEVRGVLKYYNKSFMDKNMYMCLGLAITFYAFWTQANDTVSRLGTDIQIWTVPIVIIIAMKYSLDIEKGESGDPIEVILSDKWLMIMAFIYAIIILSILYFSVKQISPLRG